MKNKSVSGGKIKFRFRVVFKKLRTQEFWFFKTGSTSMDEKMFVYGFGIPWIEFRVIINVLYWMPHVIDGFTTYAITHNFNYITHRMKPEPPQEAEGGGGE